MSDSFDPHKTRLYAVNETTDPQLLLDSGPMRLRDFNPKGVLRFTGRKCVTCDAEIMDHWLRQGSGDYWCEREGGAASEGITGCVWDVPE
jgi:hypothetical protein